MRNEKVCLKYTVIIDLHADICAYIKLRLSKARFTESMEAYFEILSSIIISFPVAFNIQTVNATAEIKMYIVEQCM